jgi:hypothetical protein
VAVNEAKDEIRAVSEQTLAALYQRWVWVARKR